MCVLEKYRQYGDPMNISPMMSSDKDDRIGDKIQDLRKSSGFKSIEQEWEKCRENGIPSRDGM